MNIIPFHEADLPEKPQLIKDELWFGQQCCLNCNQSSRYFIKHVFPVVLEGRLIPHIECPACGSNVEILSTHRMPQYVYDAIYDQMETQVQAA